MNLWLIIVTLWLCQNSYWKLPFSSWIYPLKMILFHGYVNVYQRVSYDSHMIHETMWIYYDLPRGNDYIICAILRTIQSLEGLRFVPDLEVRWWYDLNCLFFTVINLKIFLIIVCHWYPGCIYLIYVSFFLSSFSILDFHYICPGEPSQELAKDIVTFLQAVVQEWETITDSKLESFLNFHSQHYMNWFTCEIHPRVTGNWRTLFGSGWCFFGTCCKDSPLLKGILIVFQNLRGFHMFPHVSTTK